MAGKRNAPPGKGGARDQLGGWSHSFSTVGAYRAQLIVARYAVPVEIAATIAALAFGGGAA